MEYENSKWYKILYNVVNVIEKIIYFFIGIILPLQVGWVNRQAPYSSHLTKNELSEIGRIIGFSAEKTTFYLDNIFITISALIIILIFKISARAEMKYTNFKIIKKVSICIALMIITLRIVNGN